MRNELKKWTILFLSASLVAAAPAAVFAEEETSAVETADTTDASAQSGMVLYITAGENYIEKEYEGEASCENLVAAIADETGWNLCLAGIEEDPELSTVTVKLGKDSSLYQGMSSETDNDYTLTDKQELVYSILTSISDTLYYNTQYNEIFFASPEGDRIDIEEEDCTLHLSNSYRWINSSFYENTQRPLSDDTIGTATLLESYNFLNVGGTDTLNLLFRRSQLERGTGALEIYDGDELFLQADITDEEMVTFEHPDQQTLDKCNFEDGTLVTIQLEKPLECSKEYHLNMPGGLVKYGDILSKEISDAFIIETTDYGIRRLKVETISDEDAPLKVGDSVEFAMTLGESVEKITLVPEEDAASSVSISQEEFTEDGTVTITYLKEGTPRIYVYFYEKDGGMLTLALDQDVDKE